ncbi:heme ABC transporter permease CcmB, partial [bacterium]|nr:heme ABC transporter permease CcmB [bacterium]
MHGLIFLQLQKFAQQKAGPQAWEILLKEANLPVTSYSPVRTYPDQEVIALVGAASRILKQTSSAILESFGEFIAPELIRLYGRLLDPKWKTLDV